MDSFSPFSLEFESNSLHSCNRELCTRANAVAGVVQPSCHSCHKLYFPFTHVDVFLTASAILHFFYRIPIKNLIHLLSNHSQLPSSPPTKLPLLPPSSRWRGCSRTPFGRRSWCNGVVEINYLFKVINSYNRISIFWIILQTIREILNHPFFVHPGNGGSGSGLYGYIGFGIPMHEPNG